MPARKHKISLTDGWKAKIRASVICHRLHRHVEGKLELSSTQIKAAQILLAKVVPDLARTEMTGKDGAALEVPAVFNIIGVAGKQK